jgi:hypothetical protein
LTSIVEDPYRLVGPAELVFESDYEGGPKHARYRGDWRCETRRPSSFVAVSLVDWDHWRAQERQTEELLAGDIKTAVVLPPRPPKPLTGGDG